MSRIPSFPLSLYNVAVTPLFHNTPITSYFFSVLLTPSHSFLTRHNIIHHTLPAPRPNLLPQSAHRIQSIQPFLEINFLIFSFFNGLPVVSASYHRQHHRHSSMKTSLPGYDTPDQVYRVQRAYSLITAVSTRIWLCLA